MQYPFKTFNYNVDLRTSATVAALNSGIINSTDLLDVSSKLYRFRDDDGTQDNAIDSTVSFDPKFPEMTAVYSENANVSSARTYQQRIGDTMWNVEFSAWHYSWEGGENTKWDDSSFDGPFNCPDKCNSGQSYCSTPDFVFDYTDPINDQAFKLNLYADELFTMNQNNMDPGHIGCATDTVGSEGKLGKLEPLSATDFQENLVAKPFKLRESYYSCKPKRINAFFDALGVAQGNATLFVAVVVAFIMFFASRAGVVITAVAEAEIAENNKTFTEALKVNSLGKGDQLKEAHKKLQVAMKDFLAAEINAGGQKNHYYTDDNKFGMNV